MRNKAGALSLEIFCRGGWVFKSLADRQLNTRASLMRRKFCWKLHRGYRPDYYPQAFDYACFYTLAV